ncbi:hypothetical protein I552_0442 [Mycobacterium xenopi 3993]|nr:hypothetical protein I552_0442 [Mycobacterium xenopi 3993]
MPVGAITPATRRWTLSYAFCGLKTTICGRKSLQQTRLPG